MFKILHMTSIFLNENHSISIQISLQFVPKDAINNKSALIQVMVLVKWITPVH